MWFVGAYTADMGGTATGIAVLGSRPDGSLEHIGLAAVIDSPSCVVATGSKLFAVGEGTGRISVFERGDGFDLIPLGDAPAGGGEPCQIGVYGDTVVVSCYTEGNLGVLSIDPFDLTQVLAAEGSGPLEAQQGAHAHSTAQLADGTILSVDLGADRVHAHSLRDGVLTRESSLALPPGTGPRDIHVLSSGIVLVVAEWSLELFALVWNDNRLSIAGRIALPGASAGDQAAAIGVNSDETFAYIGVRGSNRVSVLALAEGGVRAHPVGFASSEGDWPRHLALDGALLHVANQRSNTVCSFAIEANGMPVLVGQPLLVASPTYLERVDGRGGFDRPQPLVK